MADASVELQASDLFALGTEFNAQGSGSVPTRDYATVNDPDGNVQCETAVNPREDFTTDYEYCAAVPDIATDLDTVLSEFGNVRDSKIVTQVVISFNAGQQASVSITGHNHDDNDHVAGLAIGHADFSAIIPAGSGFGVPTFPGVTLGSDASPSSATITLTMNHVDREGSDGNHFVGKNITPRAEIAVEYEGIPTVSEPMTDWSTDDGPAANDGNDTFDTTAVTAHRHTDLATV